MAGFDRSAEDRSAAASAPLTRATMPFISASSVSMRRCAAALLFLASVYLFYVGATTDHRFAFYGGLASMAGGVLLLFFTTAADITGLVQAAGSVVQGAAAMRGGGMGSSFSSYRPTVTPAFAMPTPLLKTNIAESAPPSDPSTGKTA